MKLMNKFYNIFDSHSHSDNSPDGTHNVTFMCEKAVEKELSGLCITDHCEMDAFARMQYARRITQSSFEVAKAKHVFYNRVAVMSGIEIGQPLVNTALTEQVIASHEFDMVMISQHNSSDGLDYYELDYDGRDIPALIEDYFDMLYTIAKWNKFDVLAHLTYPLRYIVGVHQIPVDMKPYAEKIREILRIVAQNGKAIEINTSGLRQPLGCTMPSLEYVKLFRELGGEYITIGSDSHSADTLGDGVDVGMQMLKEAGFNYFPFYQRRQPRMFPIL